ncbi:acyl-CoA dehydrogenase, middle domain protein [Mycobacterium ulcerans str. Harvey]|uniref:Acyl-CoA dehydrogenase, middle domain protein n=1 Tax=Mycobacterium ulcerans str. Harvey TaxID=1299332 RepID=A0ABP3AH56_MYCUL|nr:acyl-CoA dehydrogenase, middle domain protein [Mycobacterium ulcerans str. Harvey]
MDRFGTDAQKSEWTEALITGERSMAFGLTEPLHGSDATWMQTRAEHAGDSWIINGAKRFNTGVHRATHDRVFARTSGEPGRPGASPRSWSQPTPRDSTSRTTGGR